jgi:hypothetical protein
MIGSCDFHAGLDLGVSRIDDAERRLTTRDIGRSGSDIDRHGHFRRHGRPHAKFLQRGLGVEPDRDLLDVTGCDPTIARELGKIEPWVDVDVVDFGVFAGDQYQNVAEQIDACALIYDLFLLPVTPSTSSRQKRMHRPQPRPRSASSTPSSHHS